MTTISITTDFPGQVNVMPQNPRIVCTDSLEAVTTSGYLDNISMQGHTINPTDVIEIIYNYSTINKTGTFGFFIPTITEGIITLSQWFNSGNVVLPVSAGDIALFYNTEGQIYDAGISPSNISLTHLASVGTTISNYLSHFSDTSGTLSSAAANVTNPGNISAGLSGTAGSVTSYPATATTGSLSLTAVSNSGNYANSISNASTGQATTWSMADPGTSASNLLQASGTLTTGHLLMTNGTSGVMTDAGVAGTAANKAATNASDAYLASTTGTVTSGTLATFSDALGTIGYSTANFRAQTIGTAGSTAANTVTDANCKTTSIVYASYQSQTNPASILTIAPANGSFLITSNTAPGNSVFQYIIVNPQ
jgi:hypothetical protein